jgi:hypothetical protein
MLRLRFELSRSASALLALLAILALTSCDLLYDPATRLDAKIDAAADHLGNSEGATSIIKYRPPDIGRNSSYAVQFDKVGALIVWYKNLEGTVTASGSTSHIAGFVDIPRTYMVEKPAGATLTIELERMHGRAVIAAVH